MSPMKAKFVLGSILGLIALTGCGKGNGSNEAALFPESHPVTANSVVNFEALRAGVLSPRQCLNCHGNYGNEAGLLADGVILPGKFADSKLYRVLENGEMPKNLPHVSADDLALVQAYIIGLASTPTPVGGERATTSLYEDLRAQIIAPKCMICHKKQVSEAALGRWVVPGNVQKSKLYTMTVTGEMPEKGTPLNNRELGLIQDYILSLAPPVGSAEPAPAPTASPTPSPTATPTPTVSPNPGPEPTPTPAPIPTVAPTPTPAPIPTVTPTPSADGAEDFGNFAGAFADDSDSIVSPDGSPSAFPADAVESESRLKDVTRLIDRVGTFGL